MGVEKIVDAGFYCAYVGRLGRHLLWYLHILDLRKVMSLRIPLTVQEC